jgi:transposase-like protein
MKANLKKVKSQRRFTDEFKKTIVSEFESGEYSVIQLSKLHGIANHNIYQWIHRFSTFNEKGYRIVEMKDSTSHKMKDFEKKVKELERMVGQKQIKIDYLEKMIEIAKDELDIDIKKNYNTPQSLGSKKTKRD